MTAPTVLGVDIGTSAVKVGVYDFAGVLVASGSEPVQLTRAGGGSVTQDLDDLYRATVTAVRSCLGTEELAVGEWRVEAIAVDGQMAGVGLVDQWHRPVAAYDSWLDSRCASVVDAISPELSQQILAASGCAPTVSIGPKLAWWAAQHPEVIERSVRFVTAGGYVAGRLAGLAGEEAFIDPTYLHFTSIADTAQATWRPDLAAALGIPQRILPRIVASDEVIGTLTVSAAGAVGLPAGIPIVAGCGDTAAAALGAGATEEGQAFDVAGTAAVFGLHVGAFAPDPSGTLLTMRAALSHGYYALSYVGGAGEIIDWFCRVVLGDQGTYSELATLAEQAGPGAGGLLLSPHFSGRVAPASPAMRGALIGLSPAHDRAHLARALLEGIAYEYRTYAEAALALAAGSSLREVVGMGGGANLSQWNQIKADVLGAAYRPLRRADVGTRGAALVALSALGVSPPHFGREDFRPALVPQPAAAAIYQQSYGRYRAWSEHLETGYTDPATLPESERNTQEMETK